MKVNPFTPNILPKDSCVRKWMQALAITEIPYSYAMMCGLSIIGAVLKRNVYVDQQLWRVYPNLNVMLIGPSGIGKDTTINIVKQVLVAVGTPRIIGGKTIERVEHDLVSIGDPAAAYIAAGELTAFMGGKDYQASLAQDLTDLLSNNPEKDISLKSDLKAGGTGRRVIYRPTITMHAGSTVDWLHKAMPDGSLEGGFLPRFLLIVEEYAGRHIALIKHDISYEQSQAAKVAFDEFIGCVKGIAVRYSTPKEQEICLMNDAVELYREWYKNRFSLYSKIVAPYANRSRDQVARLAMLCAISRNHNFIEEVDVQFAVDVNGLVAARIDNVAKPPTIDAAVADEIMKMLPSPWSYILRQLGRTYSKKQLQESRDLLKEQQLIELDLNNSTWKKVLREARGG